MDLFFEAVDRNIADDRDKRDVLECMLIPQMGEAQGYGIFIWCADNIHRNNIQQQHPQVFSLV